MLITTIYNIYKYSAIFYYSYFLYNKYKQITFYKKEYDKRFY